MLQCTMHYGGLNDNMQGKPLKEFHKDYLCENSTHACVLLYSCMCAVTYYRTGIIILSNLPIPVMSMRQRAEKVWCSHICCSWLIRIIECICMVYSSLHNYYLYIKSCMCTMPKVLEVHGSMLRDVHYTDSGCTFSLGWLKRIQYPQL